MGAVGWRRRPGPPKDTIFLGQPYGEDAAVYLERLVRDKPIRGEIYGIDRYRGLLGVLRMGRRHINLAVIEADLKVYRGTAVGNSYQTPFQAAEADARTAKQGMWALEERYENPCVYRRRVGMSPSGS
jgi:endonuclease YncB( thermonuclease family)